MKGKTEKEKKGGVFAVWRDSDEPWPALVLITLGAIMVFWLLLLMIALIFGLFVEGILGIEVSWVEITESG